MNITKTTVHSNPEGGGELVYKKKMLGRAKIELFNRNFYKSFCVERSIKRVSHNKSFRKCYWEWTAVETWKQQVPTKFEIKVPRVD